MQLLHHLSLGNKIVVWDSLVITSINMGGPLAHEGALEELAPTEL